MHVRTSVVVVSTVEFDSVHELATLKHSITNKLDPDIYDSVGETGIKASLTNFLLMLESAEQAMHDKYAELAELGVTDVR